MTHGAPTVHQVHKAAVTRNYAIEPRIGFYDLLIPDYRTVSGVNGPLVILDQVKVCPSKFVLINPNSLQNSQKLLSLLFPTAQSDLDKCLKFRERKQSFK